MKIKITFTAVHVFDIPEPEVLQKMAEDEISKEEYIKDFEVSCLEDLDWIDDTGTQGTITSEIVE